MKFHLSRHVLEKLGKRDLSRDSLEQVLDKPEQKVPETENITCYQSRVTAAGKEYLLRVMVDETKSPPVAVTVYRTSKVAKYWRTT